MIFTRKVCSLLIVFLMLNVTQGNASTLKNLPQDDGIMMNMGLLAANSGLAASSEKMAKNIKSKYGVGYEGSTLSYNEQNDILHFQGTLTDKNSPPVFGKAMCQQFISEVRQNINRVLGSKEIIDTFLNTYYVMSGAPRGLNSAKLKAAIMQRMIISASISMASSPKNAVCSGTAGGNDIDFSQN